MPGPTLPVSIETYTTKYCEDGENFEKAITRVAKALRDDTPHYKAFREVTMDMRFMPAGRIQSAMGASREVTAWNCLSGDVQILTREFGAVPIQRVADTWVTLLDGNGDWVKCFVHDHGEQETVELSFFGGFERVVIASTLEHGWITRNGNVVKSKNLTMRGKREIADLRPGPCVQDTDYFAGVRHGLVYGDGAINGKVFEIRVCSKHEDIEPFFSEWSSSSPPSWNGDKRFFTPVGFGPDMKELPDPMTVSLSYLTGFARGWFAADGCVSTQPEATLCVGSVEESWCRQWFPLVGWHPMGATTLASVTNYGERKKDSRNLRLKKASMTSEDFLITSHRTRFVQKSRAALGWRVRGGEGMRKLERVYCPVVPTTHSFALANGIHSANCFVAPAIEDTFVDGDNSIMDVATKAAATLRQGGGIGYDFCLAPGTLITTAKRGCVPVEELQVGEELIGFAENFQLQKTVFEPAFVEGNGKIRRDSYLIETDKGQIVASADHLFVARTVDTPKKPGDGMRWIRTADLQPGNLIGYTIAPWQEQALSDSWLAGMFDGEGWATETNVGIAQNTGPVADRIRKELTGLGVDFREHQAADKLVSFVMRGKWQAYRLISMLAPTRVKWSVYGRKLCGSSSKPARILRIEHLGEQDVWATQTSTRTLIANGFLSHNSTLRPRNDIIRKLGSKSSGPIAFMEIFDAVCRTAASAGHRRGAQMGVLRVDHPDIETFIAAKQNSTYLTGFNLSIGITDEFMDALAAGKTFWLTFGGRRYREVDARELWDKIMRSTWDWAEPGVLFIDRMNEMNNLWYCEKIAATNPCGEQPLPPNGACLLGSFNLARYVTKSKTLDMTQLIKDIPHVVRAMDNVIDRGFYPLPEQGREGRAKRRMGIGVTGVANAIEALGEKFAYGSRDFVACFDSFMETLRDEVYFASAMLAKEKGSFALFDRDRYLAGKFVASLGSDAREAIERHGIRNSHLLSIAPTGTISLCADNISSGIEPVFAHQYDRTIRTMDGNKVETVQDYGLRTFGVKGKPCSEVTIDEHLQVLLTAQKNVDSAVSKTCNIGDNVTFEEFKDVYVQAFDGGAKGCTTFRTSGKRMGILVEKKPEAEPAPVEDGAACRIDPVSGMKSCE